MKHWWNHFHKAFSPEECDWLINYALAKPVRDATVGHGSASTTDTTLRRSKVRWLRTDEPELTALYLRINSLMLKANANSFGFDVRGFHEMQFTEYHAEDDGTYGWHEDNNWKLDKPFDRKLSMVVQLSDPESYTGGRLELANDPLPDNVFRARGDVIVFPSFNRHRVTPVKLGVRYSLVTWFVGPKFR